MKYKPVIGLEVHVELKTKSKMFCGCSADYFGTEPNSHTCPVCLGLPGAIPYPNKRAIEWCIMIGQALNCEIPLFSKFDRKNYFYPDLPKGYQISQYDQPFAKNGSITLSNGKKIRITRVHMEEDTAKLTHQGDYSLIDFNRSGVPLVEIVTEPDFDNSEDVVEYLKNLRNIVLKLDVSDADLEKGNMRLEPNISLRAENQTILPNYKVEVKNINSFNFVGKAIEFEITRQSEILNKGETPAQETRGFVDKSNSTISQRSKEEAADYRYFPEPDIPPFKWTDAEINNLRMKATSLLKEPAEEEKRREETASKYPTLSPASLATISHDPRLYSVYEGTASIGQKEYGIGSQDTANAMINKKVPIEGISNEERAKQIAALYKTTNINKEKLAKIIDKVLDENKSAVEDFKKGKETVIMFLVGQVMRQFKDKVDANIIKASLLAKLKNDRDN